jgi:hypothetical protein
MAWFKVTAPNGVPVQVSGDQLTRVRIPNEGETAPAAKSILDFTNGQQQATLESPDEIMGLIDGKAGPARRTARREK